jgi:hypothetical protein
MQEHYTVFSKHSKVYIPQDIIRYGSCLLDSYLLYRSFQMHFVGKLDDFEKKNLNKLYKGEI